MLWTAPQVDDVDDREWADTQYDGLYVVRRRGAIAVPEGTWRAWKAAVPSLPGIEVFPEATGRVLADGWLLGPSRRTLDIDDVERMLRSRLVASDSFDPDSAIERVKSLIGWLREIWSSPVAGSFESPGRVGAEVEKLYFDGPRKEDWPAFARRDGGALLAVSDDLVFVPEGVYL